FPERGPSHRKSHDVDTARESPAASTCERDTEGFFLDRNPLDHNKSNPQPAAIVHRNSASTTAIFQCVYLATVNNEGKLTAGPANNSAAAAPAGAPAASNPSASGISKNVGRANGTATSAVSKITT